MDIVIITIQVLAVILAFLYIIYIARQKPSMLCIYLLVYTAGVFWNTMGYFSEIRSKTIEEALMAIRFEYVGLITATIAALFFICELFQLKIRTWIRGVYIFAFVIVFIIAATNHYHGLHYTSYSLEVRKYFAVFRMEIGINYVLLTALMLCSIAGCVAIIVNAWLRDAKRKENYAKYLFLGLAALIPLLFCGLRFVEPVKDYDLVPFGLFCTNTCFILIIYYFRIFNVAESAKNEVLENMEEGIMVCDEEGHIVYTNAMVREIFKQSRLRWVSDVMGRLIPTEDGEYFIGGRYYSVTESEVYEGKLVKGKTLCFIDVTQVKEREHQLRELRDAALAANNAKSSFLANMSHEIRTPLNTILGMDELILRESEDNNILGYAEHIKMEGRTLMSLINDVLDFSKIESGKMEISEANYSIASLFHDVIVMFSIKTEEKGLDFRVNVAEDIPAVLYGDEIRIKQILSNVLSNAVKYTERGAIWLNAECKELEEDRVELVISVRDSGIGIRKEDLKEIFEKFKRFDSGRTARIEGTGLGMSITAQLLELMHGDITIESEYGIGSEFKVRIPQKVVDVTPIGNYNYPTREREKKETHTSFTAPDAKVLVVDDNVMNRIVVKGLLKRTKLQIDEAESGYECLQRTENTHYDIILLDHMMPGMDGVETLQHLKKQEGACQSSVVIVLTANAVVGVQEFYLEKGFDNYLSKPVSGTLLEETLLRYLPEQLVQKKTLVSEEVKTEETTASAEEAPMISYEVGLEYFAGDTELYHETLLLFADLWEERENTLSELLEQKNMKDYAILIHAIKGDARTLGANQLAELAYEQEMQAKANEAEMVKKGFSRVMQMGKQTVEYIRSGVVFENKG